MKDGNREFSAERLKRAVQYEEKRIGGNNGQIDGISARSKQNSFYLVRDVITITTDDLQLAVNGSAEVVSSSTFAVDLMYLSRKSTMQRFMALVHEIGE